MTAVDLRWVCDPLSDLGVTCTPETGGKPGTLHQRCGYKANGVRNASTLLSEVGFRAAVRMESQPRDMRWWYGLWRSR